MEEERGKEKGGHKVTNPNKSNEIHKEESPAMKAKSCKGFVYDSSTLKSKSRNPLCIGIPCSLPCGECSHSPSSLLYFTILLHAYITAVDPGPARVQNKEDAHVFQPHRTHKPTHSAGDEFLSRFSRNANVVAMGVAKNLRRVGNKIKDCLDDILYPYRRRPK